jgi:hypothetical protein
MKGFRPKASSPDRLFRVATKAVSRLSRKGEWISRALDLMIEKDMPIGESYVRSESFEILPFGPPRANWGRWAKISPL